MKKYTVLSLIVSVIAISILYFAQSSNQVKFVIQDINSSFKGVVMEKYSVRKGVEPTYLKVRTVNGVIDINPSFKVVDFVQIGDSINKIENENICFIINKNGKKKKFFYISISDKQREDSHFPKEWKNKWIESTTILDSLY